MLRVSTQFPDQCVLSHFLEAERGDDLVDVGFLAGDQLPIDLPDRLNQVAFVFASRIFGGIDYKSSLTQSQSN